MRLMPSGCAGRRSMIRSSSSSAQLRAFSALSRSMRISSSRSSAAALPVHSRNASPCMISDSRRCDRGSASPFRKRRSFISPMQRQAAFLPASASAAIDFSPFIWENSVSKRSASVPPALSQRAVRVSAIQSQSSSRTTSSRSLSSSARVPTALLPSQCVKENTSGIIRYGSSSKRRMFAWSPTVTASPGRRVTGVFGVSF